MNSQSYEQQNPDYYPEEEQLGKSSALKLKWSLGLNYHIFDGVHNLTNETRKEIFIPVANQGVIFDYENNLQRQLQGHCNQISSTAYNKKLDIIVTADQGEDSMLVIWDVITGTPRKTIFNPHTNGVEALDINEDGNLIVTLSKAPTPTEQVVTLWKWQEEDACYISAQMDEKVDCIQKFIKFNHNEQEFATTGQTRILFWLWQNGERGFQLYSPEIPSKKTLTQTVFIPGSPQAVSGTKEGVIIVWDISLIMQDYTQPEERRAIKTVNLMNNPNKIDQMKKNVSSPAISVLKIQGRFLVIGSSNGSVRFYDDQYRIQAWFQDIDLGAIHTISFSSIVEDGEQGNHDDNSEENSDNEDHKIDKIKDFKSFVCNDFIIIDDNARITMLKSNLFEKIDKEEKKGQILMESIVAPIVCSCVRPYSNTLVVSCENGVLYEWNFIEKPKSISVLRAFGPGEIPTCVNFSPKGKYMSVATKIGTIHIYEVEIGEWQSPLLVAEVEKSRPYIHMQTFSPDSKHLAVMDEDFGVTLFILGEKNWSFAGKVRVHYAPIRSISFGESIDQRGEVRLRLFSIAEDMKLAEYDITSTKKEEPNSTSSNPGKSQLNNSEPNSNKYNRLKLKSIIQVEQQCFPTSCIWYPINMFKENVLMTVNEHYKIKLWAMMKDNMKICKKTCLGPTYGGEINKLLILNPIDEKNDYQDKYIAYATKEKVVGIIKLPLDGNPNNTMGLIAHPGKITSISSLVDGKMFFTSGGEDLCVNMWEVDFSILAESFSSPEAENGGKQDETTFPELLEGGPNGQVMSDLKDFFYYSQIRSKDEHTTKARKLDGKVPLDAISNMMRSMGFYPTNKEIQNMQNQIRFLNYIDNYKETLSELDLNMFLKLFINNRPVYGISKNHISNALSILGGMRSDGTPYITREELVNVLTSEGQKMTEEEIRECEEILLGEGKELSEEIDAETLCHKILGFEDLEEDGEGEGEEGENDGNNMTNGDMHNLEGSHVDEGLHQ